MGSASMGTVNAATLSSASACGGVNDAADGSGAGSMVSAHAEATEAVARLGAVTVVAGATRFAGVGASVFVGRACLGVSHGSRITFSCLAADWTRDTEGDDATGAERS